jgi:branched-chain amino acid transport system substrate-binding protein
MRSSRIILVLLFIVSLTCCNPSMQAHDNQTAANLLPSHAESVNIALVVPLSGENIITGQNFVHSTAMALRDLNNPLIKLMTFDSNLPAHELASKIEMSNPAVILGPIYSEETQKLAAALTNKELCILSFSNNSNSLNHKNCILLLGIMPEQSLLKIIDYSKNKGFKTVNILLPQNKYGQFVNGYLTKNNLKNIAFYETNSPIKEQLTSNKGLQDLTKQPRENTAILLPDSRALAELSDTKTNNNLKLIGGSLWEDKNTYSLGYLEKSWFASLPMESRARFESRFMDTYGYKPLKIASLGYDAITLIATILNNNASVPIKKNELLNRNGFNGITGLFRFLPDGTNERSFSVYEISNKQAVILDPAPEYFTN